MQLHLTIAQSAMLLGTAGWLMVRAALAKRVLRARDIQKCPACGRLRTGRRCPCGDPAA